MDSTKLTKINIFVNILLFVIKLVASIITNSISIISDTLNTFLDIITAIISNFAVKISGKDPDEDHRFGHSQAEPISALIIAILAAVIGFEVIRSSIIRIINFQETILSQEAIIILIIAIIFKLIISITYYKFGKKLNSPVIEAIGFDSRNDVLSTLIALVGFLLSTTDYYFFDSIFGLIIGLFILKSSYDMSRKNLKYLMGRIPEDEEVYKVKNIVQEYDDVLEINDILGKYDGNNLLFEIDISINGDMSSFESCNLSNKIISKLEKKDNISKVFVKMKPITKNTKK